MRVEIPDLGTHVEFPDGTPPEQIDSILRENFDTIRRGEAEKAGLTPEEFDRSRAAAAGDAKIPLAPPPEPSGRGPLGIDEPLRGFTSGVLQLGSAITNFMGEAGRSYAQGQVAAGRMSPYSNDEAPDAAATSLRDERLPTQDAAESLSQEAGRIMAEGRAGLAAEMVRGAFASLPLMLGGLGVTATTGNPALGVGVMAGGAGLVQGNETYLETGDIGSAARQGAIESGVTLLFSALPGRLGGVEDLMTKPLANSMVQGVRDAARVYGPELAEEETIYLLQELDTYLSGHGDPTTLTPEKVYRDSLVIAGTVGLMTEGAGAIRRGARRFSDKPMSPAEENARRQVDRYDDIVSRAASEYGIPSRLIKAVIHQESEGDPNAVSHAGAKGLMQLMDGTAGDLGVTDPFDPAQNIMGGARYLRQMIDRYEGDLDKALAAYNAGMGRVDEADGIPDIPETQDYVKKVRRRLEYHRTPQARERRPDDVVYPEGVDLMGQPSNLGALDPNVYSDPDTRDDELPNRWNQAPANMPRVPVRSGEQPQMRIEPQAGVRVPPTVPGIPPRTAQGQFRPLPPGEMPPPIPQYGPDAPLTPLAERPLTSPPTPQADASGRGVTPGANPLPPAYPSGDVSGAGPMSTGPGLGTLNDLRNAPRDIEAPNGAVSIGQGPRPVGLRGLSGPEPLAPRPESGDTSGAGPVYDPRIPRPLWDARVDKGEDLTLREVKEIVGEGTRETLRPIRDEVNEAAKRDEEARAWASENNAEFNGVQEMPEGYDDYLVFTDKEFGSTVYVEKMEDATETIENNRKQFRAAQETTANVASEPAAAPEPEPTQQVDEALPWTTQEQAERYAMRRASETGSAYIYHGRQSMMDSASSRKHFAEIGLESVTRVDKNGAKRQIKLKPPKQSAATKKTSPTREQLEAEGKQPWQMTKAQFVGDSRDADTVAVRKAAHANHVKNAVQRGEDVPAEVLEAYKNGGWAAEALERAKAGEPQPNPAVEQVGDEPMFADEVARAAKISLSNALDALQAASEGTNPRLNVLPGKRFVRNPNYIEPAPARATEPNVDEMPQGAIMSARGHIIHRSTAEPGMIQVTYMDPNGEPTGHTTYNTIGDALQDHPPMDDPYPLAGEQVNDFIIAKHSIMERDGEYPEGEFAYLSPNRPISAGGTGLADLGNWIDLDGNRGVIFSETSLDDDTLSQYQLLPLSPDAREVAYENYAAGRGFQQEQQPNQRDDALARSAETLTAMESQQPTGQTTSEDILSGGQPSRKTAPALEPDFDKLNPEQFPPNEPWAQWFNAMAGGGNKVVPPGDKDAVTSGGTQWTTVVMRDGKVKAAVSTRELYERTPGEVWIGANHQDEYLVLEAIEVDPQSRRQGLARQAMLDVLHATHEVGLPLVIEPGPIGSAAGDKASAAQLREFYRSLGFVPHEGGKTLMVYDPAKNTDALAAENARQSSASQDSPEPVIGKRFYPESANGEPDTSQSPIYPVTIGDRVYDVTWTQFNDVGKVWHLLGEDQRMGPGGTPEYGGPVHTASTRKELIQRLADDPPSMAKPTIGKVLQELDEFEGKRKTLVFETDKFSNLTFRWGARGKAKKALGIINVQARDAGQGSFDELLGMLAARYPDVPIYVEQVQTEQFAEGLQRRGFRPEGDGENNWIRKPIEPVPVEEVVEDANEALQEFRSHMKRAGIKPPDPNGAIGYEDLGFTSGRPQPGYFRRDGAYTWDQALQEAELLGILGEYNPDPSRLAELLSGPAVSRTVFPRFDPNYSQDALTAIGLYGGEVEAIEHLKMQRLVLEESGESTTEVTKVIDEIESRSSEQQLSMFEDDDQDDLFGFDPKAGQRGFVRVPGIEEVGNAIKKPARKWLKTGGDLPEIAFQEKERAEGFRNKMARRTERNNQILARAIHREYSSKAERAAAWKEANRVLTNGELQDIQMELTRTRMQLQNLMTKGEIDEQGIAAGMEYIASLENDRAMLIDRPPNLKPDTLRAVQRQRESIDDLVQYGLDNGVFAGDMAFIVESNMGYWTRRSYQMFDNPRWFDEVQQDQQIMQDAREYVHSQFPDMTMDEVDGHISALLRRGQEAASKDGFLAMQGPTLGSQDITSLIKRKFIAKPIRRLMGEYNDPRVNAANSVKTVANLISNKMMLDTIVAEGMGVFLFEKPPNPQFDTRIASDGNQRMKPIDGLYTTKEIADAFKDVYQAKTQDQLTAAVNTTLSIIREGKTVYNPASQVRNFVGNTLIATANGDLLSRHAPESMYSAMKVLSRSPQEAIGAITGVEADTEALWQYTERLIELNLFEQDATVQELRSLRRELSAYSRSEIQNRGNDVVATLSKINRAAEDLYQAGDTFWKIAAFETKKKRYANYARSEGWSEQELEEYVADMIRNTYPTYGRISRLVNSLKDQPLLNLVRADFISWPAEIFRTSINIVDLTQQELRSENPELRRIGAERVVGILAAGAIPMALQMMSAAAEEIDGEKEEAMRNLGLPPWSANNPIYFLPDKNGNKRYVDIGFTDPYAVLRRPIVAMMRGDNWVDAMADGAADVIGNFSSMGIAPNFMVEFITGRRLIDREGSVLPALGGPQGRGVALRNLAPGFLNALERIVRAQQGRPAEGSERTYDLQDELVALFGLRFGGFKLEDALKFKGADVNRRFREIGSQYQNDIRQFMPEEEARAKADAARAAHFRRLSEYVDNARSLGMNAGQIRRVLIQEAGMPTADAVAAMTGRPRPYMPPTQQQRGVGIPELPKPPRMPSLPGSF